MASPILGGVTHWLDCDVYCVREGVVVLAYPPELPPSLIDNRIAMLRTTLGVADLKVLPKAGKLTYAMVLGVEAKS